MRGVQIMTRPINPNDIVSAYNRDSKDWKYNGCQNGEESYTAKDGTEYTIFRGSDNSTKISCIRNGETHSLFDKDNDGNFDEVSIFKERKSENGLNWYKATFIDENDNGNFDGSSVMVHDAKYGTSEYSSSTRKWYNPFSWFN